MHPTTTVAQLHVRMLLVARARLRVNLQRSRNTALLEVQKFYAYAYAHEIERNDLIFERRLMQRGRKQGPEQD